MEATNPYEQPKLVDEYLLFHYGEPQLVLPHESGPHDALNFAVRTVTETIDTGIPRERALDIGCSVGRSSLELSRFCHEVVGIDFSSAFIDAANGLRAEGKMDYEVLIEGHATTPATAVVPSGTQPEHVRFETGDAMNLRDELGLFELVHAANLVCRLPEPMKFLDRLPSLVSPGGQLVLTTPCTWLGEFTPPENWPDKPTIDWLQEALGDAFKLERTLDLPFLIRETARKFQWSVAQGSVWTRE
ncbi:MAG: putative 4-mercaptohistidine N1-methyltransferase [Verrucomicrobiota bacterium]